MSHPECTSDYLSASEDSASVSLSNLSIIETVLPDHNVGKEIAVTLQISHDNNGVPLFGKTASVRTTATSDPRFEVEFEENDQGNPRNWPVWYKGLVIFFMSWTTWRSVGFLGI